MYYFVEKSIVVVKPKKQFMNWLKNNFDDMSDITLAQLRIDCNSYLIPEIEEIEDGINYIDERFSEIFRLELATWTEDTNLWPPELNPTMFWEWFDIEVFPSLIDLSEDDDSENDDEIIEQTLH